MAYVEGLDFYHWEDKAVYMFSFNGKSLKFMGNFEGAPRPIPEARVAMVSVASVSFQAHIQQIRGQFHKELRLIWSANQSYLLYRQLVLRWIKVLCEIEPRTCIFERARPFSFRRGHVLRKNLKVYGNILKGHQGRPGLWSHHWNGLLFNTAAAASTHSCSQSRFGRLH